jgi:threonylcarbamoyladenosine tRNA methylthiotransferase MtaB
MPHLHLSLQHGDNLILKRMKRRHSREDVIAFTERARKLRPEISFGADIIAGFPTETEEMFEHSVQMAGECGISKLHVFPFSPRKGTPAARMPQLERSLIKERAARLRAEGERLYRMHLERMVGRTAIMLVENTGMAHTENFTLVDGLGLAPRTLAPVRIVGHDGKHLIAEALREAA